MDNCYISKTCYKITLGQVIWISCYICFFDLACVWSVTSIWEGYPIIKMQIAVKELSETLTHNISLYINHVSLGTYYAAVIENRADFFGRVVVDVGAGSGILSLFAAQVDFAVSTSCIYSKHLWFLRVDKFVGGVFINEHFLLLLLGWRKTCLCCRSIWNGRICTQTNCWKSSIEPTNNGENLSMFSVFVIIWQ